MIFLSYSHDNRQRGNGTPTKEFSSQTFRRMSICLRILLCLSDASQATHHQLHVELTRMVNPTIAQDSSAMWLLVKLWPLFQQKP